MTCPHCQTAHVEPAPRFCDGCGLALPRLRSPAAARAGSETLEVRCSECGVLATARRCRACGARVRWPEDVIPPDEGAPGKPPAPALELPDGEDAGLDLEGEDT